MFKPILIVSLLLLASGPYQRTPDLSGDWVLVGATASRARSGGEDRPYRETTGETRTTANTFSGAAFNCGRECTIVHKGLELTVHNARLSSKKTAAPVVTLHLDGRQMSVVDSFSPNREISVMAKWNGLKLEVASLAASDTVTQSVGIEAEQLVVIGYYRRDRTRSVTLRYEKRR